MKKTTSTKKLILRKITVATLSHGELRAVAGGLPMDLHTHSVCADQCCDTDQFTNCASRVGICW